MKIWSL